MISQNQNLSGFGVIPTQNITSIGLSYECLIAETANRQSKVTIQEQWASNVSKDRWGFRFRYPQKTNSFPKEMCSTFLRWQNSQRAVVLFHSQLFLNFGVRGVSGNTKRKHRALRRWPKPVGELPNETAQWQQQPGSAQPRPKATQEEMDACTFSCSEHSLAQTRLMYST